MSERLEFIWNLDDFVKREVSEVKENISELEDRIQALEEKAQDTHALISFWRYVKAWFAGIEVSKKLGQ